MKPLEPGDPRSMGGIPLRARLGRGGFGDVFLGRDGLGRWVAVKALHNSGADPQGLERFAREAQSLSRVSSPFLAQVSEVSISSNPPFVVTQFVPGPTLREGAQRPGHLSANELQALAVGTASALSTLSASGLVHRDIKPSNIILSPEGPVIVDLGIALDLDAERLTVTNAVAGTPAWMSPEQSRGLSVGPAADMWAWGRCLQWCSEQPGSDPLSPELTDLVERALSDDPALRPTADQVVASLAATGAESFVRGAWGRLGGFAAGMAQVQLDRFAETPTLLDDASTQMYAAAAPTQRENQPTAAYMAFPGNSPTPPPAGTPPVATPPVIVQASGGVGTRGLVAAMVIVGLLVAGGIAGAAVLMRQPTPAVAPVTPATIEPAPSVTMTATPEQPSVAPAPTVTATRTVTPEPQKAAGEPATLGGGASEQDTISTIIDYMNSGRWAEIPYLCNPESVCYTQLIDFFQKRFNSGQFIRGAVGPVYQCPNVPAAWSGACDSYDTWLAEFSWTCQSGGGTGTQTEVGKLNFSYGDGVYLSWFDGTRNTPRIGAPQCG